MKRIFFLAASVGLFLITFAVMQGCKADELPEPENPTFCDSITATYNAAAKSIIDSKCALSGCHGGPQSPSLSSYATISAVTDRIAVRALDVQNMPPAGMPQLTEEEKDILNCWRNAGFPEQ